MVKIMHDWANIRHYKGKIDASVRTKMYTAEAIRCTACGVHKLSLYVLIYPNSTTRVVLLGAFRELAKFMKTA